MVIHDDIAGALNAIVDGGTVTIVAASRQILVANADVTHCLTLGQASERVILPAELPPDQLTHAGRTCMAMRVRDGFTWNDYAREIFQALIAPYRRGVKRGGDVA